MNMDHSWIGNLVTDKIRPQFSFNVINRDGTSL